MAPTEDGSGFGADRPSVQVRKGVATCGNGLRDISYVNDQGGRRLPVFAPQAKALDDTCCIRGRSDIGINRKAEKPASAVQ